MDLELSPPWTRVLHLEECTSTNDVALAAARDGEPYGLVVVADTQTAGRGRADRSWTTAEGGLAMSFLLRPHRPRSDWGWVPLLAGAAVARAAQTFGADAKVKWPNDVLVDGGKLAGLLAETDGDALVLGIGLNVGSAPDGAASLAADRQAMAQEVVHRLSPAVFAWECNDFRPDSYRAACSTLGQQVRVELPGGRVLEGIAESVDDRGCLVVAGEAVSAGDVIHVRPG